MCVRLFLHWARIHPEQVFLLRNKLNISKSTSKTNLNPILGEETALKWHFHLHHCSFHHQSIDTMVPWHPRMLIITIIQCVVVNPSPMPDFEGMNLSKKPSLSGKIFQTIVTIKMPMRIRKIVDSAFMDNKKCPYVPSSTPSSNYSWMSNKFWHRAIHRMKKMKMTMTLMTMTMMLKTS